MERTSAPASFAHPPRASRPEIPARLYRVLLGAAAALGLWLRASHLLLGRSLWLDEVFLATAVVRRSLGNILALPLPYGQTPPPLFLVLAKSLESASGPSDMVLRALPFVAGCLALALFPLFAGRHGRRTILLGLFLLAVSYGGVYYSAEFKPYSVEALLTVLFLLAGMRFLRGEAMGAWTAGLVALFGLGPWLGFNAAFMIAGLAGGLAVAMLGTARPPRPSALALLALGAASFAAMYFLYAGRASATQYPMEYWKQYFAPAPFSLDALAWHALRAGQVAAHFFGLESAAWGLVLAGLATFGGLKVLRRDPAWGTMLALPILSAWAASLAGKFPLHERLMVFALPVFCLMLAEGTLALGAMAGALAGGRSPASAAPGASLGWTRLIPVFALLLVIARPTARMTLHPDTFERQEFKKLCREVLDRRAVDDAVFVFQTAIPALEYYRLTDPRLAGFRPLGITRNDPASVAEAVKTARAAGHGWVLFAHRLGAEEKSFTEAFEKAGAVRDHVAVKGAWAFAFSTGSQASVEERPASNGHPPTTQGEQEP